MEDVTMHKSGIPNDDLSALVGISAPRHALMFEGLPLHPDDYAHDGRWP